MIYLSIVLVITGIFLLIYSAITGYSKKHNLQSRTLTPPDQSGFISSVPLNSLKPETVESSAEGGDSRQGTLWSERPQREPLVTAENVPIEQPSVTHPMITEKKSYDITPDVKSRSRVDDRMDTLESSQIPPAVRHDTPVSGHDKSPDIKTEDRTPKGKVPSESESDGTAVLYGARS
jgi:hypothetical protein